MFKSLVIAGALSLTGLFGIGLSDEGSNQEEQSLNLQLNSDVSTEQEAAIDEANPSLESKQNAKASVEVSETAKVKASSNSAVNAFLGVLSDSDKQKAGDTESDSVEMSEESKPVNETKTEANLSVEANSSVEEKKGEVASGKVNANASVHASEQAKNNASPFSAINIKAWFESILGVKAENEEPNAFLPKVQTFFQSVFSIKAN